MALVLGGVGISCARARELEPEWLQVTSPGVLAAMGHACLDRGAMELRFDPVVASDARSLARFLSSSDWPFNLERRIDDDWVRGRLESGHFFGNDSKSFWVRGADEQPVALARIFDLADITPLLDLKVAASARGRGVGTLALRGVTAWLFSEHPKTGRLGGYTRHDNLAMRRVFEKCGFQQEALHRKAWAVADGEPVDCVGYAILRDEFVMPTSG